MNEYLTHHGILGQKWGIRRYQNEDGSLTAAGKKRFKDKGTFAFYERRRKKSLDTAKKHAKNAAASMAVSVGIAAVDSVAVKTLAKNGKHGAALALYDIGRTTVSALKMKSFASTLGAGIAYLSSL